MGEGGGQRLPSVWGRGRGQESGVSVAVSLCSVLALGARQDSCQGLALTSWCLHQPCLSRAAHRTSAWQRWPLRRTGASAVCACADPRGAGSHTAAARPVGRGMWLRASPLGPRGASASPWYLACTLGLGGKGNELPAWLWQWGWRSSQVGPELWPRPQYDLSSRGCGFKRVGSHGSGLWL